jgi:hypothetical protein
MLTFVHKKTVRSVCNTEAMTKWMVMPCSLYLAASDFHLFGPLKDNVNDQALLVICQWLQIDRNFYQAGIHVVV